MRIVKETVYRDKKGKFIKASIAKKKKIKAQIVRIPVASR